MIEPKLSVRKGNYASAVMEMATLKASISAAEVNKPFYFSVNVQGSGSKIFYTVVRRAESDSTKFIAEFFKDQTKYVSGGMEGMHQEDYFIKAFATKGTPEVDMTNPDVTDTTDASAKEELVKYVEIFLDAVQVLAVMPY